MSLTFRLNLTIRTELVLGLNWLLSGCDWSAAHAVASTDPEQVLGVFVEATDAILRGICSVCRQRPSLPLHVSSLHHIRHNLTAAVALRLLPRQADLTICRVHHTQVLHWAGDVCKQQPGTDMRRLRLGHRPEAELLYKDTLLLGHSDARTHSYC